MRRRGDGSRSVLDRAVDLVVNPQRYVVGLTVVAYATGFLGVGLAIAGAGDPSSTLTAVGIALMGVCLVTSFATGMAMASVGEGGTRR